MAHWLFAWKLRSRDTDRRWREHKKAKEAGRLVAMHRPHYGAGSGSATEGVNTIKGVGAQALACKFVSAGVEVRTVIVCARQDADPT